MRLNPLTLSVALGLCLTTGLALPAADAPSDLERIVPGRLAPDFRLLDADGKTHALGDHRGQPVIVVFYRGHW